MLENLEFVQNVGQTTMALVVIVGFAVTVLSMLLFGVDNEAIATRIGRGCIAMASYCLVAGLALHVYSDSLPNIDHVVEKHQSDQVTSTGS